MPMNTMLVGLIGGSSSASSRTWPAISNGSRLREKPIAPVAQNAHCSAHPACDEMHNVSRFPSGMATVSIAWPSARRKRNLRVPSTDCWSKSTCRRGIVNREASWSRSSRGRSLIASNDGAGFTHRCAGDLPRSIGRLTQLGHELTELGERVGGARFRRFVTPDSLNAGARPSLRGCDEPALTGSGADA